MINASIRSTYSFRSLLCLMIMVLQAGSVMATREMVPANGSVNGGFGSALASLPDIDGDGCPDIVVGASGDLCYSSGAGQAYLFSGLTGARIRSINSPVHPTWGRFGCSVASLPDTNANGTPDLVAGAYGEKDYSVYPYCEQAGHAYVFDAASGSQLLTLVSPTVAAYGNFGKCVSGSTDLNGDGKGDIIVGAPGEYAESLYLSGRVHVFSGANGALIRSLNQPIATDYSYFGSSVMTISDVNSDGVADILAGAYGAHPGTDPAYTGAAYVYSGATGAVIWTLNSTNKIANGYFGRQVSSIPDTTGDGVADVLVGAPGETAGGQGGAGRVYQFNGATGALIRAYTAPTPLAGGGFGNAVAGIRDTTGDGLGEIVIGGSGYAFIYNGSTGALICQLSAPGNETSGFGSSIAAADEFNGDSYGDVLMGASSATYPGRPSGSGVAYLVTSEPEADVSVGGAAVANGGSVDFGRNGIGYAAVSKTFTVTNKGYMSLSTSNFAAPAGYSITDELNGVIAPCGSDTFALVLPTSTLGTFSGAVSFNTNDGNENPYSISIMGQIMPDEPEIEAADGATPLADGSGTITFGTVLQARTALTKTFTVTNIGPQPLTITNVSVPEGFTITEPLSATLAAFTGSDTFTVTMPTDTPGVKSGTIQITSNDTDEATYDISITGTVEADVTPPTATITLAGVNPTHENPLRFNVAFSEGIGTSFDAGDITTSGTLAGMSSIALSGSGTNYTVTVSRSNSNIDGTIAIVIGTGIVDIVGNSCPGAVSQPYLVDKRLPFALRPPVSDSYAWFGNSVARIDDVTTDGINDLAVGSPWEQTDSSSDGGKVYLYDAVSLALVRTISLPGASDGFGYAVAQMGDANGDGQRDLVISEPGNSSAYLVDPHTGSVIRTLTCATGRNFGYCAGGIGDVDGDGCPDVIVGDNEAIYAGYYYVGCVYVMSGATGAVIRQIYSPHWQEDGYFGSSVASVGDLTGDGIEELVVGGFEEPGGGRYGFIYIFNGATGALVREVYPPGGNPGCEFGTAVATIQDLDGDGKRDIIVGSPYDDAGVPDSSYGRAYVISSATGAVIHILDAPVQDSWDNFGSAVASMPDTNGDGIEDVAVGDKYAFPDGVNVGRVFIYSGANGELLDSLASPFPSGENFGAALAGLKDVNGDGLGDLVTGAYGDTVNGLDSAGGAYVCYSRPRPEIAVYRGTSMIASGSPAAFGTVYQEHDPAPSITFTVRNSGATTLTTTAISAPAGFTVTKSPAASLAPQTTDTLTVQMLMETAGAHGGTLSFATNDADENPFTLSLSGTVNAADHVAPVVSSIVRAGANPTSAATVNFTVNFSEPVTGVTADNFSIDASSWMAGTSVASVTGSGSAYTVTVNTTPAVGTVSIDLNQNLSSIQDVVGNPMTDAFIAGEAYNLQRQRTQDFRITAYDAAAEDEFGYSVDIDGDTIIVGADCDDDSGSNSGSAYVYVRDGVTSWVLQAKLAPGDPAASKYFGEAVAISGNTIVVGASGAAYVFVRNGTAWTQQAKLVSGVSSDGFGSYADIDGDNIIVGAHYPMPRGAAYIFHRTGSTWAQAARLEPTDIATHDSIYSDTFGGGVRISGDTVLIANRYDDTGAREGGSAYVYRFDGSSWNYEAELIAPDVQESDEAGFHISLCGNTAGIVSWHGDYGAVYIWQRTGTTWSVQAELQTVMDPNSRGFSGCEIQGDFLVCGACVDKINGIYYAGETWVYQRFGSTWTRIATLQDSSPQYEDEFGLALAISNGTVVVGASQSYGDGFNPGKVDVFGFSLAPSVTRQPEATGAAQNAAAQFSIKAAGSGALAYQWKKDGSDLADGGNIDGATSSTLTINSVQSADVGVYSCVITNAMGSVESTTATLVMGNPPTITAQPGSAASHAGDPVTFTVSAEGMAPLAYQWKKNGTNIPGASGESYSIASVQESNEGVYACHISNVSGFIESDAATLVVNNTPSNITLTGATINENSANDTVIGTLSSTDLDAGSTFTYSFVAPNGDAGGRFKIADNQLQVANGGLLDYESAASHQVTVRTTDNSGLTYDKSFTITINNVNESPADVSLSASSIAENSPNDTVIGTLSSADQDAGATFTYSFVAPGSDAGGRFKIVGNQIQVADGTLLNYEAAPSHQVTVRTTDNGGLTFDKTFTITVADVNDGPTATMTLFDQNPTPANWVRFRVVFSESVGTSFDASDVTTSGTLAAGAMVSVSGSDSNYTVTVTPADPNANGTITIVIGTGVTDLAGDLFAGAQSGAYSIDNDLTLEIYSPNPTDAGGYGFSLGAVPDLNGDGLDEFIAGAPWEHHNSINHSGRAYLYDGATFALLRTFVSPEPTEQGEYGFSVAGISDVNNDGTADILIGAPGENSKLGKVYVLSGATGDVIRTLTASGSISLGCSMATLGDIDADSVDDIVVGADGYEYGMANYGNVYIFSGASGTLLRTMTTPNPGGTGEFGFAVAKAPDVTGDGLDDIVVGAPCEWSNVGRAYIFNAATGAHVRTFNAPHGGGFGYVVAGINDLDGDGLGDIIVGAPDEDRNYSEYNVGGAYVYSGATGNLIYTLAPPYWPGYDEFGFAVASMPDYNGDGVDDIVVNHRDGYYYEPRVDGHYPGDGRVLIYSGTTGEVLNILMPYRANSIRYGTTILGMRDLNGDGLGDLVLASDWDTPPNYPSESGTVFIESSSPSPVADLYRGTTMIWNGGSVNFGSVYQDHDTTPTITFTLRNDGATTLTTANLAVPAGFVVTEGLSAAIAPQTSDTVTVQLSMENPGTFSGQLVFNTNDETENPYAITISGTVNAADHVAPTVSSIARVGASPTHASSMQFTVTFNEPVTGVTADNFSIDASGPAGAAINEVTGSGTTWTVTVGRGSGDGTLSIDLNQNLSNVIDVVENPMTAAYTAGEAYTIDTAPPTNITLNPSSIAENSVNGTVVGTLTTTDPDPENTFTYSFVGPYSDASGRFTIVGNQIRVANGSMINFETGTSHLITVCTTDRSGLTYQKTLTILVTDVNEAPTNITLSASVVNENVANDSLIGNFTGSDPDPDTTFSYSFVAPNGDAGGRFKIVGSQLRVANRTLLDYEAATSHMITVRATDTGGLTYDKSFTITVNNLNEAPTALTLSGASADENAAADTVVGTLASSDQDAGATFTYSFVDDAGGRFKIVGNQIQVANGSLLDFESAASHQITVRTTDNGGLTLDQSLTINLRNLNEAPTDVALSSLVIDENAANDSVVATLSATDPETTNTYTYTFVAPNGDGGGRFKIVGGELQVANTSLLDYESSNSLSITVRATDNGGLTFDKSFTILLRNVNDAPTNISLSATAIAENPANNTVIGNLGATDQDTTNTTTYSLIDAAGGRFKVVGSQLQVADGSLLDYEAATSHLITVRATDNGGLYYDKSFTITVNNANESPTNISLSGSSVNENAMVNTVVGNLSTSDPDSGNTFTYSLVPPNSNAGYRFKLVGTQLKVDNGSNLDYEAATSHLITVRTTDQGGLYYDKTFTITLNNVNEMPTNITLSATAVNENAANDTVVANVTATDPDAGSTFTYAFVAPYYNAGSRFKIVNGQLLVADGSLLNYESQSFYGLTIQVTDNGGLTFTKSWTININNVNETPTNITLSASAVNENAANNTVVGTLSSADPDSAQTYTYSLVAPNGDGGGRFKISGNQLQVANGTLLDRESATNHLITVRTTDQGGLYYEKTFTITVNNVNETPTDVALSAAAVNENAANNMVVGSLTTTDPDTGNTFTYTFVSPNSNAGGRFKIVGTQIQVNNSALLNYEAAASHLVTVRTTDQGGLYFEKTFTITVNNVDEAPSDIALSASAVNENAANDTVIGDLGSTDQDAGATFTYIFVGPNSDGGGRFKIVGNQIQVANASLLDYESATSHLVTIRTTDNTGLTYDKTLTVTVNNVNEMPTDIALSTAAVDENVAANTVIGSLTSTDPDAGNTFTYSFVAPNNDAGGRFKIVGGQIQVANASLLDYESATSHLVTVRTTDNGGLVFDKTLTITLNNVNEMPTDISLSASAVNENAANDTAVANLTSTDPDAGSTFTYSFVAPNSDAGGRFKIVGNQIQVADGSLLNYESATSHLVTVRTTDNGGLHYDETFTITVGNVNEAPTDITLSGTSVDENSPANTVIGTLSAIDPDTGETFAYSFTDPYHDCNGLFKVVGNQLQLAGAYLNYEARTSYQITVIAYDHAGQPYKKDFTITVNNVPEVEVYVVAGYETPINDGGGPISFGTILHYDTPPPITFTVFNNGDGTMTTTNLMVPNGYGIVKGLSPQIAPMQCDTFQVRLLSATVGTFGGTISFGCNDPDENPFNFTVTGTVEGTGADLIFVNLGYLGEELGTQLKPFNTLAEGIASLNSGGTLRISTGTTSERPRITKTMRLEAVGGPVRIGVGGAGIPSPAGSSAPANGASPGSRNAAADWKLYR